MYSICIFRINASAVQCPFLKSSKRLEISRLEKTSTRTCEKLVKSSANISNKKVFSGNLHNDEDSKCFITAGRGKFMTAKNSNDEWPGVFFVPNNSNINSNSNSDYKYFSNLFIRKYNT